MRRESASKAKVNGVSAPTPAPADPPEASNLDKVRDILFGQQSRDIERRLERTEERFRGDLEGAQRDASDRAQALENFVRQELQALKERVSTEAEARLEAAERAARQAEADRADAERKLTAQAERFQQSLAELREAMLEQGKRFSAELKAARDASQNALEREVGTLTRSKVDRSVLARELADLALLIGSDGEDPA
jgi:DNA anti-recombination protein RmuC